MLDENYAAYLASVRWSSIGRTGDAILVDRVVPGHAAGDGLDGVGSPAQVVTGHGEVTGILL